MALAAGGLSRLGGGPGASFLRLLPQVSPVRATAWWVLILVRGALPATFTIVVGALVGAVQSGGDVTVRLALVGAVFLLMNSLGPLHEALSADLGLRTGAHLLD